MTLRVVPPTPTIESVERCMMQLAFIVDKFGEVYMPLFQRMEAELQTLKSQQDTMGRVRQMLANQTLAGGLKAIR